MLKQLLLFIVFLLFCVQLQGAGKSKFIFTQYTEEEGLCDNYLHDITQDDDGFIWIATHFGISRFDGLHFKNFHVADYPRMLRNDVYHAFNKGKGEIAFAGSNGSIVVYDKKQDTFIDYSSRVGEGNFYGNITGLYSSKDGHCYLSTALGTFRQNRGTHQFDRLPYATEPTYKAFIDAKERFWKCTDDGIQLYALNGDIVATPTTIAQLKRINNILPLSEKELLLSSSSGDFYHVKFNDSFENVKVENLVTPFKNIAELVVSRDGSVWIGTAGNGLWRMTTKKDGFTYQKIQPSNADKESMKKISALYEDRFGNIWIGTQNSGLWKCRLASQTSLYHSSDIGLNNLYCTSFFECDNGDIWIGTDGQGLFLTDSVFSLKYHLSDNNGLTSSNVLSISSLGLQLYFASWGGEIVRTNGNSLKFTKVPFYGIPSPTLSVKYIEVIGNDKLLACTSGDGVYLYENGEWRVLDLTLNGIPDRWIHSALETKDGKIWILTSRTIWHGTIDSMVALLPDMDQNPSHNPMIFYQALEDNEGNLWVASNNGMYKITAEQNYKLEPVTFLPKGTYKSLLLDKNGQIWNCGSNGIIKFDPKTERTENIFYEGEKHDFFVERAIYQKNNEEILFGCENGFYLFNPSSNQDDDSFFVEWAEMYVNNEKTKFNKDEKLILPYDKTKLDIRFDMIDFSDYQEIYAEYRVLGLDSVWMKVQNNQTISFSHLPHGEFCLEARFFQGDKMIENETLRLDIEILPAWWATPWFQLLMFLLIVVIVFAIFKFRTRRIERQKHELEETVAERTQKLNEAHEVLLSQKDKIEKQNSSLLSALKDKNQLISIIAHDLKNPMFSIVCGLEHMLKQGETINSETTRDIYHSATTLQSEMLQLLDWATEGQYEFAVRPQNVDAQKLIKEVLALLGGLLREKNIKTKVVNHAEHHLFADEKILSTILRNIITNAIKFSPVNGSIVIEILEENGMISIKTTDSGAGIEPDKLEAIMNGTAKSSLGTNNEMGHGLGFRIIKDYVEKSDGQLFIESKQERGTTVTVVLKTSDVKTENKKKTVLPTAHAQIVIDKKLLEDKSILIIDDDPLILLHLKNLLAPYVQVFTAANGEEGILVAKQQIPDLVISDIDMPGMNGFEMYQKMKDNLHTSNIPLIFLSAHSDLDSRLTALSGGAIDFINKPFDDTELLAKICNIILWLKNTQMQVLINKMNDEKEQNSEKVNPLLEQLMQVVETHYTNPNFSFDDIAQSLGMSKSTLIRRLKSLTDKSPVEILSEYRLNKAKKRLENSSESVSEVAYQVGFNDPLYFSRKFKEAFGISPSKVNGKV
ncbi:MAG: response regulator [Paludibacteraceae bacterium]|nr:response regulator [Paludibacteraceae bacterium]